MGVVQQTRTLIRKNILIAFVRHWFSTSLRAFILPVIFIFIIAYAKNFIVPPSNFGIGAPTPITSLENALSAAKGGRDTIVFVNNGHIGGQIESLINLISESIRTAGKQVRVLENNADVRTVCRSSLRGATSCFAAANFHSSPSEGEFGVWNYTLRGDGSFSERIFVDQSNNDVQVYLLPLQQAIDSAIASLENSVMPSRIDGLLFTDKNEEERDNDIQERFMKSLVNVLGVTFFVGIVGVTYQLTGNMALEREQGMSQLIEAMTPNRTSWFTQTARFLSYHFAFDIIYLPSWIVIAIILSRLVFLKTSPAVVVFFHILTGLSLSSYSLFGAAFFRKAQLSGITLVLISLALGIIAQAVKFKTSGIVAVLSLLFPPMTYTYFIAYLAQFESASRAAKLDTSAPQENTWQLPGYYFFLCLVVQILVFPLLGMVVERSRHHIGSKKGRRVLSASSSMDAIKLSSFSKTFRPSQRWLGKNNVVKAVDGLSLTAHKGQILVLLGANGSGKSTTLNAISGLTSISGGTIELDGTGGFGYCPQKNVLWDELTPLEHVSIFNGLKCQGKPDPKSKLIDLLAACDLQAKTTARTKTLSGGQKRKVQLAMMFTGGSSVCCVDEVSSGLDPLSRRKIWDILLAERGPRTFILTTHFLDEADVLSDHIAILSKGRLVTEGSSVELKNRFGGGYHVKISSIDWKSLEGCTPIPYEESEENVIFQLENGKETAQFLQLADRNGISEFQVYGPTIEDVFLKLAEEMNDNHDLTSYNSPTRNEKISVTTSQTRAQDEAQGMSPGKGTGILRQTWILFQKRLTIIRRNYLPYLTALVVPIATTGGVVNFVRGFSALPCNPSDSIDSPIISSFSSFSTELNTSIPIGPSSQISIKALANITGLPDSYFHLVESLVEFKDYISQNYSNIIPGGFFLDTVPVFAYRANIFPDYSVITKNALTNVLMKDNLIATQYQTFDYPFSPGAGDSFQLILYFTLAMSAYPAFFALYPTIERLRKVRALHYSNGIRAAPLWIAYLLFDFVFVLIISTVVTGIFISASSIWYFPGYLFLIFCLYGTTSILLSYTVSLFVTSQLAAFAFSAGMQAALLLIYFISFLSINTWSLPSDIDNDLVIAHFTLGLISPSGNLLRTMLLTLNEYSLLCRGRTIASYPGEILIYGGPIVYLILQALALFTFIVWWDSGWRPSLFKHANKKKVDEEDTNTIDEELRSEISRVERPGDALRVCHLAKSFGHNKAVQDISFGIKRGEAFALLGPNGAGKSTIISLIRGDLLPSRNGGNVFIEDVSVISQRTKARSNLGVCPQFDAMDKMTVVEHLRFYAKARGVPSIETNVAIVIHAVGLETFSTRLAEKLSGGNKRKLSLAISLMGNPSVLLLDEPSSGMDAAAKRVMWKTLLGVAAPGRALLITTHSMEEADKLATRAGIMRRRMLALGTTERLRRRWGDAWYIHIVLNSAPNTPDEEMERVWNWIAQNVPGANVPGHGEEVTEDKRREERSSHGQLRFKVLKSVSGAIGEGGDADRSIARLFTLLERNKGELGFEYYSISPATLDQVFLKIVGETVEGEE